uniref:Protein kinase domain-containing protein n=1 Tax=Macrostomum lignano TaxID=282301 RepID=A0A1I8FP32_9PLAT
MQHTRTSSSSQPQVVLVQAPDGVRISQRPCGQLALDRVPFLQRSRLIKPPATKDSRLKPGRASWTPRLIGDRLADAISAEEVGRRPRSTYHAEAIASTSTFASAATSPPPANHCPGRRGRLCFYKVASAASAGAAKSPTSANSKTRRAQSAHQGAGPVRGGTTVTSPRKSSNGREGGFKNLALACSSRPLTQAAQARDALPVSAFVKHHIRRPSMDFYKPEFSSAELAASLTRHLLLGDSPASSSDCYAVAMVSAALPVWLSLRLLSILQPLSAVGRRKKGLARDLGMLGLHLLSHPVPAPAAPAETARRRKRRQFRRLGRLLRAENEAAPPRPEASVAARQSPPCCRERDLLAEAAPDDEDDDRGRRSGDEATPRRLQRRPPRPPSSSSAGQSACTAQRGADVRLSGGPGDSLSESSLRVSLRAFRRRNGVLWTLKRSRQARDPEDIDRAQLPARQGAGRGDGGNSRPVSAAGSAARFPAPSPKSVRPRRSKSRAASKAAAEEAAAAAAKDPEDPPPLRPLRLEDCAPPSRPRFYDWQSSGSNDDGDNARRAARTAAPARAPPPPLPAGRCRFRSCWPAAAWSRDKLNSPRNNGSGFAEIRVRTALPDPFSNASFSLAGRVRKRLARSVFPEALAESEPGLAGLIGPPDRHGAGRCSCTRPDGGAARFGAAGSCGSAGDLATRRATSASVAGFESATGGGAIKKSKNCCQGLP